MANEEQLRILLQGVEAWNAWRRAQHPGICVDLSDATLKRCNFSGINLGGAILSRTDLSDTIMNDANLSHTELSQANLSNTIFSRANLRNVALSHADLRKADLIKADLSYADLSYANLSNSYLNNAILSHTTLAHSDLSNAILSHADLGDAILSHTTLSHADLSDTILSHADLSEATLPHAILKRANLSDAILNNTDLSNTTLHRTIFHSTHLNHTIFNNAIMGQTIFVNLDLRTAKGLETTDHTHPSTVGTDTLELSGGRIPEIFLRNIGMSNSFIYYALSQAQSPRQYHTCFISYSSKDELFAQRIYKDLQQEGVRCWFAPEDMKIGDTIKKRIAESIQMHDKLLLILSKHAMESEWVEYEVEAALAKERQEKRTVLVPIRLDNTLVGDITRMVRWAEHIHNTRHIGNFEYWNNQDAYSRAFQRLLRDLETEATDYPLKHNRSTR